MRAVYFKKAGFVLNNKGLGFNQLIDSLLAINTILRTQLESHQGISRNFQQTLHCTQDFDLNLELPFIKGFEN